MATTTVPLRSAVSELAGLLDSPEKSAPGDAALRIVQEGKPVILHLRSAPAGSVWLAAKQKDKILGEGKDLLADLCSYRNYLCTSADTRARMPNDPPPNN